MSAQLCDAVIKRADHCGSSFVIGLRTCGSVRWFVEEGIQHLWRVSSIIDEYLHVIFPTDLDRLSNVVMVREVAKRLLGACARPLLLKIARCTVSRHIFQLFGKIFDRFAPLKVDSSALGA